MTWGLRDCHGGQGDSVKGCDRVSIYTFRGGVKRGTERKVSTSEPMKTPQRWRGGRRSAGS